MCGSQSKRLELMTRPKSVYNRYDVSKAVVDVAWQDAYKGHA